MSKVATNTTRLLVVYGIHWWELRANDHAIKFNNAHVHLMVKLVLVKTVSKLLERLVLQTVPTFVHLVTVITTKMATLALEMFVVVQTVSAQLEQLVLYTMPTFACLAMTIIL